MTDFTYIETERLKQMKLRIESLFFQLMDTSRELEALRKRETERNNKKAAKKRAKKLAKLGVYE